MDKRKDEIKAIRIERENDFIDINFVEEMAVKVTDDLVEWANRNIFEPLGGELSLEIPAFGEPNARAITYWETPYSPVIEIRLSMFKEIYRDAFTFPLISKRIEDETNTINQFHDSFAFSYDDRYMYETGIPKIPTESTKGNLKHYFTAFLKAYNQKPHENINSNDIACRFVMFEIVVAWIFFHELGHLVQRHHMIKDGTSNSVESEILEIDENLENKKPNISGQAREVMADAEGLDMTLKYMKRKGILQSQSVYLLLCGVNCMYQRFYQKYEMSLDLANGSHPHPVIRNEFFHSFLLDWVIEFLDSDKSLSAPPLAYMSVRSSLMSGLFWAHRFESFDGDGLPTYMDLSSENYHAEKDEYMSTIRNEIIRVMSIVKHTHILSSNCIALFEKSLTNQSTRTA